MGASTCPTDRGHFQRLSWVLPPGNFGKMFWRRATTFLQCSSSSCSHQPAWDSQQTPGHQQGPLLAVIRVAGWKDFMPTVLPCSHICWPSSYPGKGGWGGQYQAAALSQLLPKSLWRGSCICPQPWALTTTLGPQVKAHWYFFDICFTYRHFMWKLPQLKKFENHSPPKIPALKSMDSCVASPSLSCFIPQEVGTHSAPDSAPARAWHTNMEGWAHEPTGGRAARHPGSALTDLWTLDGSQKGLANSILEMQLSWPTWTGFYLFSSFPCSV